MSLTPRALLEVQRLTQRARALKTGSRAEREQADVLLAEIAAINNAGISPDEAREGVINALRAEMGKPQLDFEKEKREQRYKEAFRRWLMSSDVDGQGDLELRDLAAGSQSIAYTSGITGGFAVPSEFYDQLVLGMALTTPLLDETVVTLDRNNNSRNKSYPAWDSTKITSTLIGENTTPVKEGGGLIPAHVTQCGGYLYRTDDIAASFELEQDYRDEGANLGDVNTKLLSDLMTLMGIGLARGMGANLQYGTGYPNEPSGLIQNATSTGIVINENSFTPYPDTSNITLVKDLENIFFSVDKIHRAHPSCSWVMNDEVWKFVRQYAASASRPLPLAEGEPQVQPNVNCAGWLFGKRVLIDNTIVGSNGSSPSSNIVFGNMSRFVVKLGPVLVKRNLESRYVERGQALYNALAWVDSNIIAAGDEPIVTAEVTS